MIIQMSRAYEDQQHEKDGVVVRYAQAEQRNIELNDRVQKAELKIREWTKERDVALGKWKTLKEEKVKLSELCESRVSVRILPFSIAYYENNFNFVIVSYCVKSVIRIMTLNSASLI